MLDPGSGEEHLKEVLVQQGGIEHTDCPIGFALRAHGDKGKAPGFAAFRIGHDVDRHQFPCHPEQGDQILRGG